LLVNEFLPTPTSLNPLLVTATIAGEYEKTIRLQWQFKENRIAEIDVENKILQNLRMTLMKLSVSRKTVLHFLYYGYVAAVKTTGVYWNGHLIVNFQLYNKIRKWQLNLRRSSYKQEGSGSFSAYCKIPYGW
jgi:hypothetical protein